MASTSVVLPAPVGPLIAKRSRPEKSISARFLKAVSPCTASLLGRTGNFLVELVEERHQRRRRLGAMRVTVVGREHLGRALALDVEIRRRFVAAGVLHDDIEGVGEDVAHLLPEPGY